MPEYRVLERVAEQTGRERIHLAKLDTSRSLCYSVTFDGSPFDPWQITDDERGPEDCDGAERCSVCWGKWETAKRTDRTARGLYVPPDRTHVRAPRRKVAPQVASQRIADAAPVAEVPDYFRMYRADLERLGTPEASAELARRAAKREAKRSKVSQSSE